MDKTSQLEHFLICMDPFSDFLKALKPWTEIRVRWRDAYAPHSGWHEVEDYEPEEAIAITLGRYWADCQPNYLTIAGTVFEADDDNIKTVGDINHIPLGWITSIEVITHSKDIYETTI